MKKLVVHDKKEWREGPHAAEWRYKGLPVEEDQTLPPRTFYVLEQEDEG